MIAVCAALHPEHQGPMAQPHRPRARGRSYAGVSSDAHTDSSPTRTRALRSARCGGRPLGLIAHAHAGAQGSQEDDGPVANSWSAPAKRQTSRRCRLVDHAPSLRRRGPEVTGLDDDGRAGPGVVERTVPSERPLRPSAATAAQSLLTRCRTVPPERTATRSFARKMGRSGPVRAGLLSGHTPSARAPHDGAPYEQGRRRCVLWTTTPRSRGPSSKCRKPGPSPLVAATVVGARWARRTSPRLIHTRSEGAPW